LRQSPPTNASLIASVGKCVAAQGLGSYASSHRSTGSNDVQLALLLQPAHGTKKANGLLQTEVANGVEALDLEQQPHTSSKPANRTLSAKTLN
jgi:hypothetical protein